MSDFVQNASFYVEGNEIEIFKSNALVEGAYDLSPAEHDLLTLAINKLFSQSVGGKQVFISAKEFAVANKINENYAYEVLAETAKRLQKRTFKTKIYKDGLKILAGDKDPYSVARPKGDYELLDLHANWVQAVAYQEKSGFIYLMFSDVLAYLIQKTGESYTRYPYEKTIDLKRFHTKRLYELCCKRAGSKPPKGQKYPLVTMMVDEWRDFFGCTDKYEKVAEFKRWVIVPAIKEINEQGEFELILDQEKLGKIITHLTLTIKDKRPHPIENKERDVNTVDMFDNLTDKERQIADSKLAWADQQGITDPAHRKNLVKHGIDRHRQAEQAEQERQEQAKAQAKAKADAEKADLLIAGQIYADLLQADDEVIEDFVIANQRFFGSFGAEKHHFDRAEYRLCLQAMAFRFKDLSMFRQFDLSALE